MKVTLKQNDSEFDLSSSDCVDYSIGNLFKSKDGTLWVVYSFDSDKFLLSLGSSGPRAFGDLGAYKFKRVGFIKEITIDCASN